MKTVGSCRHTLRASLLLLAAAAAAADPAPADKSATGGKSSAPTPRGAAPKLPVYKPPQRGAPEVKVNAGSRGATEELPALYVLAPNHAGLTLHEQPTLYWYAAKATPTPVEISIALKSEAEPLLELNLDSVPTAGLQSLSLSKHGVKLKPGLEYQWVVALVPDAKNRSKDVVASGVIKPTIPTPELKQATETMPRRELPRILAEHGIWFDAIELLLTSGLTAPADADALNEVNSLLEQVDLKDVQVRP